MAGPALAVEAFLIIATIVFLLTLLYIIFKKRKRLLISIPLAVLLLGLVILVSLTYREHKLKENAAAKKYLGDYKLVRPDGQDCQHCLVRLNNDYRYYILKDDKVVGHGKWWLETAIDIPGSFLQIENGPKHVM